MVLPPSVRRFGWLLSPTYAQFFSGENLSDKTQICSRPLGSAHPNSQRVSRPQLCAWSRDGTSTLAISWSQEENNGGLGMLWVEKKLPRVFSAAAWACLLPAYRIPRNATFLLKTIPVSCWSGGETTYPCLKWKTRQYMTIHIQYCIWNPASCDMHGNLRSKSIPKKNAEGPPAVAIWDANIRWVHGCDLWRGAVPKVDFFWIKLCHDKWINGAWLRGTPSMSCSSPYLSDT